MFVSNGLRPRRYGPCPRRELGSRGFIVCSLANRVPSKTGIAFFKALSQSENQAMAAPEGPSSGFIICSTSTDSARIRAPNPFRSQRTAALAETGPASEVSEIFAEPPAKPFAAPRDVKAIEDLPST